MCKIAFNFAISKGISINKLNKSVTVISENGNVESLKFNYTMFPYVAMNQFDWNIETITPVALFHHLAIFNVEDTLWCYIDLFNTFQCYILLDDQWDEDDIYESYSQMIEEIDRTVPDIRIRKPKHILTYSQIYRVEPTQDIAKLNKQIKVKIQKAPYERSMNDIIKEKSSLLEPIIDMMNNKTVLYDYLRDITFYCNENDDLIEDRYKRFTPRGKDNKLTFVSYPHAVFDLLSKDKNAANKYTNSKFDRLNEYLVIKGYEE